MLPTSSKGQQADPKTRPYGIAARGEVIFGLILFLCLEESNVGGCRIVAVGGKSKNDNKMTLWWQNCLGIRKNNFSSSPCLFSVIYNYAHDDILALECDKIFAFFPTIFILWFITMTLVKFTQFFTTFI